MVAGLPVRVLVAEAVVDQLRMSLVGEDADVAESVPCLDPPTEVLSRGQEGAAPLRWREVNRGLGLHAPVPSQHDVVATVLVLEVGGDEAHAAPVAQALADLYRTIGRERVHSVFLLAVFLSRRCSRRP